MTAPVFTQSHNPGAVFGHAEVSAGAVSVFLVNVDGVPTQSLGLRAWNGSAVITPSAKIWNGTAWEAIQ